ncbi:MAG: ABC transporter ATP-binding protein [Clostridia bacterium]|nr:ABC transporter ATP-binding protein [Clostridia bacterium]MBP3422534.1 ABC transporter ATP-binding protein [Clostridia bacterium]
MENIIQISHLYKSYGEVKAVQDLSFCVKKGELFAFLGLNGAGKSTTISIMCGQLKKDGGMVEINGKSLDANPEEIKREIGVVFQNSVLDKPLSVYDNLKTRAALYGIEGEAFSNRLKELDELFSLNEVLKRPYGKLSGGQRRRVDVARALLHKPSILILDEPTTGLDPQTRKNVWLVLDALRKKEGMTVFLTTHYMEEAADADYVVILDNGKIAAEGTPLQLKNEYAGDYISLYNVEEERVQKLGKPYEEIRDGYRVSVADTREATALILANPDVFTDYEIVKGRMDDVFLAVTGKKLEGGNV